MASDALSPDDGRAPVEEMITQAETASAFLKALSHEGRLMILCHLSTGEKTVSELEELLSSRQAAVSQQLARLRLEGLVTPRRDGKAIYYSLADARAQRMLDLMHELFCSPEAIMAQSAREAAPGPEASQSASPDTGRALPAAPALPSRS